MSLCSALDIHVIQSIAPMCKKSTKVAPFQMAGNAECQGQRQILSQSRALFYFNWVGLGEATEVVWGWGRQQHRLGTSHCPFLCSHIPSGLKLLGRCHRDLEVPGQAHLALRAEVSASSCHPHSQNPCHILPKKFMVTFHMTLSTMKPFPWGFGAQGSPSPCRPSHQPLGSLRSWARSCQAPVKSCLIPRNAAPGRELRLPQLSLKWIFQLREDFFGLVLLKRNLQ